MASFTNKQFWREFIEVYRAHPVLWQVKSDNYKNKNIRNDAYNILLEKLKEIQKDATVNDVRKKINGLRNSYRRELKKVKRSEKSGAGSEDIYIPSLWYFDDFQFLESQESSNEGRSTMESEDEEGVFLDESTRATTSSGNQKKRRIEEQQKNQRNIFLEKAVEHLSQVNDESEILARSWAAKYRKLSSNQQILAMKAIDEIFYKGICGKLTENMIIGESSGQHRTSTPYFNQDTYSSHSDSPFSPISFERVQGENKLTTKQTVITKTTPSPPNPLPQNPTSKVIRILENRVVQPGAYIIGETNLEHTSIASLLSDTQFSI